METVTVFIFLGSQITADGNFSHKIKRHLLLGRKAMTNLDSILKSRDITWATMVCIVKAIVFFPVGMYGCENWAIKKAEHQGIDILNCGVAEDSWESLGVQGDQTSESSRKSILNSHWKDWCWSWSSNGLVTWWEKLTYWKCPWCWERWRQEEKGMIEDVIFGWLHRLNGQFESA